MIKNKLKFFQGKEFMRISIIAEEELTQKVLVGLKNNFIVSGLGRLLDVLLDEGVDALAAISAVADLDRVAIVTKRNACTQSGVIAVDVEDFGMARCNAHRGLLKDPAHKNRAQRQGTTHGKGLLCEAIEFNIIEGEVR